MQRVNYWKNYKRSKFSRIQFSNMLVAHTVNKKSHQWKFIGRQTNLFIKKPLVVIYILLLYYKTAGFKIVILKYSLLRTKSRLKKKKKIAGEFILFSIWIILVYANVQYIRDRFSPPAPLKSHCVVFAIYIFAGNWYRIVILCLFLK